jgi:hypothetical protein
MALSQTLRDQVERRLTQYCIDRIPEHARQQVRMSFRIRANNVTLLEERPAFMEPERWLDIPVAQFRFRPEDATWMLYWPDRNSRWHEYDDVDPTDALDDLLREVDKDPTGIFWG